MTKEKTGVGEYTYNLLKAIIEQDNNNEYYLFYNSHKDVSENIPKFNQKNVHYCEFKWPNKLLSLLLLIFKWPKFDKWIKKQKNVNIDLFFLPNICFFAYSCPYFITAHDLSYKIFPEFLCWKRKIWHWIINPKSQFINAQKVIAVSENTKNDLIKLYKLSENKIQTIYSGLNPLFLQEINQDKFNQVKQKYNLPEKFILFTSALEPRKNIETIIQAFKKFKKQNPDYYLVISGPKGWKYQNILSLIRKNKQIIYTNFVESDDRPYLYKLAQMFIYPSYYEGFGFPPLEALSQNCPIIAGQNSALTEVLQDSALYVLPQNVNDLFLAMNQLKNNKIRTNLLNKSRNMKFKWSNTASKFLNLIKNYENRH